MSNPQADQEIRVYDEPLLFAQVGGFVSMEAEDFTTASPGTGAALNASWQRTTSIAGYSGSAALAATPNAGINLGDTTQGPRLNYSMTIAHAGTYYIWVRMHGRSGTDDSLHVGVDGTLISGGSMGVTEQGSGFRWVSYAGGRRLRFSVTAPRTVTLNVWMREDGTVFDKLFVTNSSTYVPSNVGPAQTPAPASAPEPDPAPAPEPDPAPAPEPDPTPAPEPDPAPAPTACLRARQLWFDDFETGTYERWTSGNYVSTINGGGCYTSGFSTERARTGTRSHRTSIACTQANNHRIYGGMQFSGDTPLPRYTNTGAGIDAPNGIVVTYFTWLDSPLFGDGRWMSLFTSNNSCDWSDAVVTIGLEDASNRITPAHIWTTGGTVTDAPTRSALPMRQWVRTTVYLNYHTGALHVWQDGQKQFSATFSRNSRQICQFHWGLYASGNNSSITLFEDDYSIWKLDQPITDFTTEPWLGQTQPVCAQ